MRCSLIALSLLVAAPALAAPFGVRLTQFDDPATTVAISWNSDVATENVVVYGTSADALTQTFTVDADNTYPMPDPLGTGFSARITGLTPSTTYFYKVGAPGALHPEGEPFSFSTFADDRCAPLRFVVIGDNRADTSTGSPGVSPLYEGIINETLASEPMLFVNTGDMVKDGEVPEEWFNMITTSEPTWARIPSITTQGNHDTGDPDGDGALYNRLYELPRNDVTATEDYYSIDIGAVHFVSLNTQHLNNSELPAMSGWLDADLAATTQPWKIIFFHKGVYSRGNHYTGEEEDDDGQQGVINRVLTPIFDEHDVDLVLNGHSHNYERYVPTVGFDEAFGGSGRQFPAGDKESIDLAAPLPDGSVGTTYVVTGGGGARTTDIPGFDNIECIDSACTFCTGIFPIGGCERDVLEVDREQANIVYDGSHHFVAIEIAEGQLRATVVATETGNNGSELIDEFVIQKPAFADACGDVAGEGEGEAGEGEGETGEGEGEGGEGEGEDGEGEGGAEGEGENDNVPPDAPPGGCSCRAADPTMSFLLLLLLGLLVVGRRVALRQS